MKKITFLFVLLCTSLCIGQTTQFVDGFENVYTGNLRDDACWDPSSSNVQVRKTPDGRAQEGYQYAEAKDGEYIISQKYYFEIGKPYTISFYYDIETIPSTNSITVSTNISGTYSNPTTVSKSNIGWTLYTTTFTPTSTGQGIFKIAFATNYSDYNILIDNIIIVAPTSSSGSVVSCVGSLPVKFISFTGKENNGDVILNWTVADEVNNDKYVIENSIDGKVFTDIGEVSGIKIKYNQYTFTQHNVVEPVLYYRIKQVDYDGATTYTNIIYVATNYLQEDANIYDFQGNFVYQGILLNFFKYKAVIGKNYIVYTKTRSFKVTML